MNLEQALEERLHIINCTPADIKAFIKVGQERPHGALQCAMLRRGVLSSCVVLACCAMLRAAGAYAAGCPCAPRLPVPQHAHPAVADSNSPERAHRPPQAHPPESRLVPGVKDLISALQARGVAVYLISGGFRWWGRGVGAMRMRAWWGRVRGVGGGAGRGRALSSGGLKRQAGVFMSRASSTAAAG